MGRHTKRIGWVIVAVIALASTGAWAGPLFSDDFESGLSLWTGKYDGAHNGAIVVDPLDSENNVLTFGATNSGGDIFTVASFDLTPGQLYAVSFDYLGQVNQIPGGSGGFAGLSADYPGSHLWYYGTNTTSGANPILVDDGQWHHYTYEFVAPLSIGSSVHLMFEDYNFGGRGVAEDAYFDNVSIATVPVPGAALLGSIGLSLAAYLRRRKTI